MTSVAIVNQHTNNYGDDAAGIALVEQVYESLDATEVDIFYIWDRGRGGLPIERDGLRHHHLEDISGTRDMRAKLATAVLQRAILRRSARPDLRNLTDRCKQADVVYVSPAGSNIGIYKDWMYLFVLVMLVLEGVRPVFCQNTIAKSNSWIFNRVALFVLRRSELFVREAASHAYLQSKGLTSYLGVDTALLLPPETDPVTSSPYISVVPTRLANWHRDHREFDDPAFLLDELPSTLASVAIERDLEVVLVPHLYGPENESAILEDMRDALSQRGCRARVADVSSLAGYTAAIAAAQVNVSMRYHGLILAAKNGVPCVALSYENKMVEAAQYLGTTEHILDVRNTSPDQLRAHLIAALDGRATSRPKLQARAAELQAIAMGPVLAARSRLLRG
jgi:polysaccharide pyruvyl transferase WcaK-like protein